VQVWRKGAAQTLVVTIGETPDDDDSMPGRPGRKPEPAKANRLGLVLAPLSVEQKRALGLSSGLIVEDVRDEGDRSDLQPGDIILSFINKGVQTEIKTVAQFNELLAGMDKKSPITLLVRRRDSQTFVTIKGVDDK
jgi:serine protease Do